MIMNKKSEPGRGWSLGSHWERKRLRRNPMLLCHKCESEEKRRSQKQSVCAFTLFLLSEATGLGWWMSSNQSLAKVVIFLPPTSSSPYYLWFIHENHYWFICIHTCKSSLACMYDPKRFRHIGLSCSICEQEYWTWENLCSWNADVSFMGKFIWYCTVYVSFLHA